MLGQLGLTILVFWPQLHHLGAYALAPYYDGIKSDFSLLLWLQQPIGQGALIRGHNYPFGEYLWFTDCTPLVAVPLHVLVAIWPGLLPYALGLYWAAILLLVFPFSTWLLVHVLRPFGLPLPVLALLALALPWLAPQTWRLIGGNLSLALTPALLATLLALRKLSAAPTARAAARPLLLLGVVIFAAAWTHFYYLLMLVGLSGAFATVWLAQRAGASQPWQGLAAATASALAAVTGLLIGSLLLLDPRHRDRPTGEGYGYLDWKMQFGGWFRGYEYNEVRFLLEPAHQYPYEPMQYLGALALYGLVVAAVVGLLRWHRGPLPGWLPRLGADANGQFVERLLLAALPLVLMSLGEEYELDGGAYVLHNYLNPLLWLHKLTEQARQFRALARFAWPAWWAINLLVIWWLAHWWRTSGDRFTPLRRVLVGALLVLLTVDAANAIHYYRRHFRETPNPLADAPARVALRGLLGKAWANDFQALLPIPFYHVGSESPDYPYTVDPDDHTSTQAFQASLATGLPLMAHKAARPPPEQARLLWTLFEPTGPDSALLRRLDNRPVLVYLDSTYYDGSSTYYSQNLAARPRQLAWIAYGPTFVQRHHLVRVGRVGKLTSYAWYPHAPPAPAAVPLAQ